MNYTRRIYANRLPPPNLGANPYVRPALILPKHNIIPRITNIPRQTRRVDNNISEENNWSLSHSNMAFYMNPAHDYSDIDNIVLK